MDGSGDTDGGKSTTPGSPEQVGALTVPQDSGNQQAEQPSQEGVKVGGLVYTENEDGTRNYPDQKPVKTIDEPAKEDAGIQETI